MALQRASAGAQTAAACGRRISLSAKASQLRHLRQCRPIESQLPVRLEEYTVSLGTVLLTVLLLLLVGAIPTWGHSRSWGYAPSGSIGLVLVVVVVLLLTGRL
jgi:Protein of unknown function (DUF3309)